MSMRMEQLGEIGPYTIGESRAADDGEMNLINQWALKPLTREDVAVFTMQLCNNLVDRHFSRFPDDELVRIAKMVPGIPLMESHDTARRLPRGTFFRAETRALGKMKIAVIADFFILRTTQNANFIENLQGGIYRQTSIGFQFNLPECSICGKDLRTCDHVPGQEYKGVLCVYIMHGCDVFEGSIVPVASQQGTVVFGMRNLPVCAKDGIETERLCSGCGKCSCGKIEEEDERIPFREIGDDFLDNMVCQKPSRVMAAGYAVRFHIENPRLAVHDKSTCLHTVNETYRPGCFREFLARNEEVECRLNHSNVILGRQSDGSFRLKETDDGLWVELAVTASNEALVHAASGWSINRVDKDSDIESGPYEPLAETIYSAGVFEEISLIFGEGHTPALRTTIVVTAVDPKFAQLKCRVACAQFWGIKTTQSRRDEVKMLLAEVRR